MPISMYDYLVPTVLKTFYIPRPDGTRSYPKTLMQCSDGSALVSSWTCNPSCAFYWGPDTTVGFIAIKRLYEREGAMTAFCMSDNIQRRQNGLN